MGKIQLNPGTGELDLVGTGSGGAGTVTSVAGGVGITNVPEPIVGAGTVHLDIDSLTTETALAVGDLFPFVDVSAGGTAITNQRKIDFLNLTLGIFQRFSINLGIEGIVATDGLGNWIARTLVAPAAGLTISSPTGFPGNPTFALANDLAALEGLAGTGIAVRSAADTWVLRSIAVTDTATVNLTITNADGVAGNPTLQADVLAAGIDHGGLAGLADDDHLQYLLLAGRAGAANNALISTSAFGRLTGSSAASMGMELQGNSSTTVMHGIVLQPASVNLGGAASLLRHGTAITLNSVTDAFRMLAVGADASFSPVTWLVTADPIGGELFLLEPIIQNSPSGTSRDFGDWIAISLVPEFRHVGASLSGVSRWQAVHDSPIIAANVIVTDYTSLESFPAGAGTISTYRGLHVSPGVSAITTGVGVQIDNFTAGTLALSLRSEGSAVQMRHVGPAVFGANAAPTNTTSVGLEVQSTTRALLVSRMTTAQRDALTAVDGMYLYDSTVARQTVREETTWKTLVTQEGHGTPGQTIIGTTSVTGALTLQGGNNAGVFSSIILQSQSALATVAVLMPYKTALTLSNAGSYFSGLSIGTDEGFVGVTWPVTANLSSGGGEIFRFGATIQNSPSGTGRNFGTWYGLGFFPVYAHVGASTSSIADVAGAFDGGSVGANITATGWTSFRAQPSNSGTITTYRGLHVNPSGGTITTGVGVDLEDFTASTGISFRSLGLAKSMRHAGPALFGTTGAPAANVTLDISGALAERAGNITASNGTNNDLNIGNLSFVRIVGPTAAFTITSITPTADGKRVIIYNSTTQNMTITHEAGTGTAANRFHSTAGTNFGASTGEAVCEVIYSSALSRWLFLNKGEL